MKKLIKALAKRCGLLVIPKEQMFVWIERGLQTNDASLESEYKSGQASAIVMILDEIRSYNS
jgi:hypothetical protein